MSNCETVNNELLDAIRKGKLQVVRTILELVGINYSKDWNEGYMLLRESVRFRQVEVTKLLLSFKCKVKREMLELCDTPLHFAVKNKDYEIVEMLLKEGADVDIYNHLSKSPIHLAVEDNNFLFVKLFLQYGANINCRDKEGMTPLHLAAKKGYPLIVLYLLSNGASVTSVNAEGSTPLHVAITNAQNESIPGNFGEDLRRAYASNNNGGGHEEIVSVLLEYGSDVNSKNGLEKTPLSLAVEKGYSLIVKNVLNFHPDCDEVINKAAFYIALCDGRQKYRTIVYDLYRYGFSVSLEDANKDRLIFDCVRGGHIEIFEELLKYGCDINILSGSERYTLIHCAAEFGHFEIADLLVKNGSLISPIDNQQKTPLHYAILARNFEITKLLLLHNANVEDGYNLLYLAVSKGRDDIVELLLEYIRDDSITDEDIKRLIYSSVFLGSAKVTKVLLDKGASVNTKYEDGQTLLHVAVEKKYEEVVRVLLEYNADITARLITNSQTPLHIITLMAQQTCIVGLLLDFGADMNSMPLLEEIAYHVPRADNFLIDRQINILREYLVKLKVATLSLSKKESEESNFFLEEFSGFETLKTECEREIERMKLEKVGKTCITFYDIVTCHNNKMAVFLSNTDIIEALKLGDYEEQYPKYSEIIRGKYRRGLQRKGLLKKANQFLSNFPHLPFYCIDVLTRYLSNSDLINFIDACTPANFNKESLEF